MTDFHEIYTRYDGDIYRFALFLCGDAAEAEEITAETFARALTGKAPLEYKSTLNRMNSSDPASRTKSFFDVEKEINNNRFFEIDFNDEELQGYRNFADQLAAHINKIENGSKYKDDFNRIQNQLEDAYRSFMLEETAPDSALITNCFINGSY